MDEQATLTITLTPDEGWAVNFQGKWWQIGNIPDPTISQVVAPGVRQVRYELTRLPDDYVPKRLPDRIRTVRIAEYDS
jgi:hypothetical protein